MRWWTCKTGLLFLIACCLSGCADSTTECFEHQDCDACQTCRNGVCVEGEEICGDLLDNDCDQQTDEGCPGPCDSVVCESPPDDYCLDSATLRKYRSPGECLEGECDYTYSDVPCSNGCQAGECIDEPCAGVTCDQPPDDYCLDTNTLRRYESSGTCQEGECLYDHNDVACSNGCQAGECIDEPCAGVVCDDPPGDECVDSNTLRKYAPEGTCDQGECSYSHQDQDCPFGCQAGACLGDPCDGVDCNEAPDACHGAPGSCSQGVCTYPLIAVCGDADGCCLTGCGPNSDVDCPACDAGFYPCPAGCCAWDFEVIDDQDDPGENISIALDDQQRPHLSYHGGGSYAELRYAKLTDNGWQLEPVHTSGDVYGHTTLLFDRQGRPHIGYGDQQAGDIFYAYLDGIGWVIDMVDTGYLYDPSLALDAAGNPSMTYFNAGNSELKYVVKNGGDWDHQVVDSEGMTGKHSNLVMDNSDWPHIAYYHDDNCDLRHAWFDGADWQIEDVDTHAVCSNATRSYLSMVLDADQNMHIAYYDIYKGDLKYARSGPEGWGIRVVDSPVNVGAHASLSLDSAGNPHIAYYDVVGKDLKYAFYTSIDWEVLVVDSEGQVGEHAALTLDQYDRPHVGYHYYNTSSTGELRYAHRFCEGVVCEDPPDNECLDSSTLRRYLSPGRCLSRECVYSRINVTCQHGCQAGACVDEPCAGVTCDQPPADRCLSPTVLRSYTAEGTCLAGQAGQEGSCTYTYQDLTCQTRCQQAACLPDPCQGVDCTAAPDACHGSPGACVAGVCEYPVIAACGDSDGCCLAGCGPNSDGDCQTCGPGQYPCPAGCCPWRIEVVDDASDAGQHVSIALDRAGHPRFIHHVGGMKRPLRYAWKNGDQWRVEPLYTSGDVFGTVTLLLDEQDVPHVSLPDYHIGRPLYLRQDGPVFISRKVEETTGRYDEYTSLALDGASNPHLVYYASNTYDIKYAAWTGSDWEIHMVEENGQVGRHSSLALDDNDLPHISYYASYNELLRYAHYDGSQWSIETVDNHGDCVTGTWTASSLVLDAADNPHIAYYDCLGGNLKYARWTGDAWSLRVVDSDTNVGTSASLALNSQGHPHIVYYDVVNKDLKYAFFTSQAWEILVVDVDNDAGEYAALALDQQGRPHIGYYHEVSSSSGALRYARW